MTVLRHDRTSTPRRVLLALILTLAMALIPVLGMATPANAAPVGAGGYLDSPPAGASLPQDCQGTMTNARALFTSAAPGGAVPTNDWWTSLIWPRLPSSSGPGCNRYSENLFAHPLAFRAYAQGLGVHYPNTPTITSNGHLGEYHYNYAPDFFLGVTGLNSPDTRVDHYSDWTVTPFWSDGTRTLRATIGHGLPFVYATVSGGPANLTATAPISVWHQNGPVIGFRINNRDYAAWAPSGASWNVSGQTITSTLAGQNYFSVATLPTTASSSVNQRLTRLNAYAPHAYSFVTDTRVSWNYNPSTSRVTTTYSVTTTPRQGPNNGAVLALYPHQHQHLSGATPSPYTYVSPRGQMRVLLGNSSFTTVMTFNGVLPALPHVGFSNSNDANQLNTFVNQIASGNPFAGFGNDTYWTGKALGRLSELVGVANGMGNTNARTTFLNHIRTRLTDWLTATPGKTARVLYYDSNWGTLIGYPATFGADTELNDHTFHYGYFIAAAATLAGFDTSWASQNQYGGMVNLLIKDAANWERGDTRFPFLRDFDIYAGHGWASGHGAFGAGNNKESSSESMNFASAVIRWGVATNQTAIRDLGVYLYTTQAAATHSYWFNEGGQAFPSGFNKSTVGMVWGSGGAYATWFSADPEMIHGINMLPVTGGSLYLGYRPSYVTANINEIVANRGGPPTVWRDIIWEFQALSQPATALSEFRSLMNSYTPEEGESRAHTFHWLANLDVLGHVDRSITANHPLHAVFNRSGTRTYVAGNVTGSTITVTFSNGVSLTVPPRTVATTAGDSQPPPPPPPPPGARDAYSQIEAESYDAQQGTQTQSTSDVGGGQNVGWISNGDWLRYDDVDFGSTPAHEFQARVASGAASGVSGTVQVRLGSPTAPVIGSFTISNTGGWQSWQTRSAEITPTTGVHTVFVTFASGQTADFVNINWFTFEQGQPPPPPPPPPGARNAYSQIEAESYDAQQGTQTENTSDVGGGQNVGWISNGDWLRYDNVDFGSTPAHTFRARVASGAASGVSGLVQVRLGSPTAPVIGSFAIANTGGWQSWQTVPASISGTSGTHTVFITFTSGQPADFVNVNWFTFEH